MDTSLMDQIKDMLISKEPVFMSCPLWLRAVSWLASHPSNIPHHFLSCHFKVPLLGSSLPYPMSQALYFGPFYLCPLEVSSSLLSSDNIPTLVSLAQTPCCIFTRAVCPLAHLIISIRMTIACSRHNMNSHPKPALSHTLLSGDCNFFLPDSQASNPIVL